MVAFCKPKGEASGETKCVDTLILDSQPSGLLENKFLSRKPSVCEALANEYTYYVPGVVLGPGDPEMKRSGSYLPGNRYTNKHLQCSMLIAIQCKVQLKVQRGSEIIVSKSSQGSWGQHPWGGNSRDFKDKPYSSYFLTLFITDLRSEHKFLIWIPSCLIAGS